MTTEGRAALSGFRSNDVTVLFLSHSINTLQTQLKFKALMGNGFSPSVQAVLHIIRHQIHSLLGSDRRFCIQVWLKFIKKSVNEPLLATAFPNRKLLGKCSIGHLGLTFSLFFKASPGAYLFFSYED